jgi:hypothetical protein
MTGASEYTAPLGIGSRVVVVITDGSHKTGQIVEDFGPLAGTEVVVDALLTVRSRRWAVALDDGGIGFVDDDAIAPIDHA